MNSRLELLTKLQGRRLEDAYQHPDIAATLNYEALKTRDKLVTPEMLEQLNELNQERLEAPKTAFFSTEKVIIVPGYIASSLTDVARGGGGLIWISEWLWKSNKFSSLQLGPIEGEQEKDLNPNVQIEATSAIPLLYDILRLALEIRRYSTTIFPVDWRKNIELSAVRLKAELLAGGASVDLIAHSQGAQVVRRTIQLLGNDAAKYVKGAILIGPANRGSFSAPQAVSGDHESLDLLRKLMVEPPVGFSEVFGSMTGTYQLFPWGLPWLVDARYDISKETFWGGFAALDKNRLARFYKWGDQINTDFFNDRTTIVVGDNYGQPTVGALENVGGHLKSVMNIVGDGTMPHACAVLPGVPTYLAPHTEHSLLTTKRSVIDAVVDILAGRKPKLDQVSDQPEDYI